MHENIVMHSVKYVQLFKQELDFIIYMRKGKQNENSNDMFARRIDSLKMKNNKVVT